MMSATVNCPSCGTELCSRCDQVHCDKCEPKFGRWQGNYEESVRRNGMLDDEYMDRWNKTAARKPSKEEMGRLRKLFLAVKRAGTVNQSDLELRD